MKNKIILPLLITLMIAGCGSGGSSSGGGTERNANNATASFCVTVTATSGTVSNLVNTCAEAINIFYCDGVNQIGCPSANMRRATLEPNQSVSAVINGISRVSACYVPFNPISVERDGCS